MPEWTIQILTRRAPIEPIKLVHDRRLAHSRRTNDANDREISVLSQELHKIESFFKLLRVKRRKGEWVIREENLRGESDRCEIPKSLTGDWEMQEEEVET